MRLQFPVVIPFAETLGLELWAFADGKAELRVDLEQAHLNSWEVAHGGVLMTMLDVAMAMAARSSEHRSPLVLHAEGTAPAASHGLATIEMKTSFMRAAQGQLVAKGTLLHRSTTLAFCEGSVFDADHKLCAHATGTFKYLRGLPTGGRQFKALKTAP